jgi:hypothetical protein
LGAFAPQFFGEAPANRAVAARFGNVPGDLDEVLKCGIEKIKAAQLITVLRQLLVERIQGSCYVFVSGVASGLDGGVDGVAEGI